MAKNQKNTLSDLNEFLKSTPSEEGNDTKDNYLQARPHTLVQVDEVKREKVILDEKDWTEAQIIREINSLATKNNEDVRFTLFRIIQNIMNEKETVNSSDLMLANMAIYLEHAERLGKGNG